MIGYCKDCRHCLLVNKHYVLCMLFNEEIKDTEYHSCTEFENRICPNCGIDLLEGEIDDGVCATCGHSFGEEKNMKCKCHSRLTKERVDNKSALHGAVTKYALTLIHDQKEDV